MVVFGTEDGVHYLANGIEECGKGVRGAWGQFVEGPYGDEVAAGAEPAGGFRVSGIFAVDSHSDSSFIVRFSSSRQIAVSVRRREKAQTKTEQNGALEVFFSACDWQFWGGDNMGRLGCWVR